ncbi:hypothetical protein Avbf_04127 [Armadillidium vulgare]|nr:hypothetical protein Avbf_04127 [Armadillidium vulgare]
MKLLLQVQTPYFDRSGKLNILEPVIAKTRLHEPRVLHRSPKSSPTRYYSSMSSSRFSKNSQSSKSRFGSERGTPIIKKKKGSLKKTLSVRETDGEVCHAHRQRRNSICIDVLPESKKKYFDSSLKGFKTQSRTSSKNTSPISVNDGKKLGPIDKSDSLQLLKGNMQNEKSCSIDIDEETLCADIADCDTLFMDIGAKETPQLKAARNLKGKIMKKKAQSKGTIERNSPELIVL